MRSRVCALLLLTWPNLSSFLLLTTCSTSVGDLDRYLSRSPGDTEFCNTNSLYFALFIQKKLNCCTTNQSFLCIRRSGALNIGRVPRVQIRWLQKGMRASGYRRMWTSWGARNTRSQTGPESEQTSCRTHAGKAGMGAHWKARPVGTMWQLLSVNLLLNGNQWVSNWVEQMHTIS